jgi:hypothetical protein
MCKRCLQFFWLLSVASSALVGMLTLAMMVETVVIDSRHQFLRTLFKPLIEMAFPGKDEPTKPGKSVADLRIEHLEDMLRGSEWRRMESDRLFAEARQGRINDNAASHQVIQKQLADLLAANKAVRAAQAQNAKLTADLNRAKASVAALTNERDEAIQRLAIANTNLNAANNKIERFNESDPNRKALDGPKN